MSRGVCDKIRVAIVCPSDKFLFSFIIRNIEFSEFI